jgi:hypothetical protein
MSSKKFVIGQFSKRLESRPVAEVNDHSVLEAVSKPQIGEKGFGQHPQFP